MLTAAVYVAMAALVAWAFWRRPQMITAVLIAAFALSVLAAQFWHKAELLPILIAIDSFIATAMASIWTNYHAQRARIVGGISFLNCGFSFSYMGNPYMGWNAYAAALNAAFVFQVLVAGGFADGVADRLADRYRRVFPRRAGAHRDVVR
jgi:hypothetical protein